MSDGAVPSPRALLGKALAYFVGLVAFFGIFLFAPAGTFGWVGAWAIIGLYGAYMLPTFLWLRRTRPALLAKRLQRWDPKAPRWDKMLMLVMMIVTVAMFVVAGLDRRFGWSHVAPWARAVAFIICATGLLGLTAVFAVNPYATRSARVQTEDAQTVITSGPYRFVRHPMYAVMTVHYLSMAIVLGSWWAFAVDVVVAALLVVRTAMEDRMLHEGLEGYAAYAQRTRYRLVPGVW